MALTGQVYGDLTGDQLIIEEGAVFKGKVNMDVVSSRKIVDSTSYSCKSFLSRPTLFVCATPIGNLSDISQRLVDTLKQVDLLAVEDSRVTVKLLNHLSISKKMVSIEKIFEAKKTSTIINALNNGLSVALLSDAGTPAISDPGSRLVFHVREWV